MFYDIWRGETNPYLAHVDSYREIAVVVFVSHIQRIGCQPGKTTVYGGQSRSWSAGQGKEHKKIKSGSASPRRFSYGTEEIR